MSDTKISEAAVEAAARAYGCAPQSCDGNEAMNIALTAALPHLHPQPAELAEQQGVDPSIARAISSKDLYQVLMDVQNGIDSPALASMANGAIQMIDKARNALAATGKQQVGEVHGDMFWLAVDGERMGYSVEELIDDMCDGEEVEIQTAAQLPNFWVRVKAGDGGSVDFDVIDQRDAGHMSDLEGAK